MNKVLLLVSCIVVFATCKSAKITSELKEFMGQEIVFPNDLPTFINGKDTTVSGFFNADAKMVVYYDSTACSMCQLGKMYLWEDMKAKSLVSRHRFNLIFILSPKAGMLPEVRTSLKTYPFDYPLFIDTAHHFELQNKVLPENPGYRTFLLGDDNRVMLIGNPVNNDKLWALYEEQIGKLIGD